MMFASAAVRAASRQALTASARRQFSAVAAKTVSHQQSSTKARHAAPLVAAAGLAMTAALFQQREVCVLKYCGVLLMKRNMGLK